MAEIFVSEKFRQKRPSGVGQELFSSNVGRHSFALPSFGLVKKIIQDFNLVKKFALTKATK